MSTGTESTFKGYSCWKPKDVHRIIDYEAGRPHDALILAAHSPATITVGKDGKKITEQDVLERLKTPDEHGQSIVPILGLTGSGKTHLIRWLEPKVKAIEGAFVVLIKKGGESLESLIIGILDTLEKAGETDDSKRLRKELKGAFAQIRKEGLSDLVLNKVSEQFREIARRPEVRDKRDYKGMAELLPPLLRDEAFRVPLMKAGGVVSRFLASVQSDEIRVDVDFEGGGFVFEAKDIPTATDMQGAGLGSAAQDAWNTIYSDPKFEAIAAELISAAFLRSIPQIFGLTGKTTLEAVFRSARTSLLRTGQSLYVLIEDLSRMETFEGALLESFIHTPLKAGEARELCDIHVAIATTADFYDTKTSSTFRTRVQSINNDERFSDGGNLLHMESVSDSEGWTSETLAAFSSRYLNAIRVGEEQLKRSYSSGLQRGSIDDTDWIPNPCMDGCPHQETCHSSFGATDGRGHYPFNKEALNAFYGDAIGRDELVEVQGEFNPRRLIDWVLKGIMASAPGQLDEGTFPASELGETFYRAPGPEPGLITGIASIQEDLKDSKRREVLLRFWGGSPSTVCDLSEGIHEAFGISPVGGSGPPRISGACTVDGTSTSLTWSISVEVPNGVDLRVSDDGGQSWQPLLEQWNESSFEHENLIAGTTYDYEVSVSGPDKEQVAPWKTQAIVGGAAPPLVKVDPLVQAVSAWRGHRELGRNRTLTLVDGLFTAVSDAVNWQSLGLAPPSSSGAEAGGLQHVVGGRGEGMVLNRYSFHIEGSIGVDKAQTKVVRELTRDEHAPLLIHLAEALSGGEKGAIQLGHNGYTELANYIEEVAVEVEAELSAITESDADDLLTRALAERLALGGLIGGASQGDLDHLTLAEMVFAAVPENAPRGAGAWVELVGLLQDDRVKYQRALADRTRTTQGSYRDQSSFRVGRIVRLLKPLLEFLESSVDKRSPVSASVGPPGATWRLKSLKKRMIDSAVKERLEELAEATGDLKKLLGSGPLEWKDLKETVETEHQEAIRASINDNVGNLIAFLNQLLDQSPPRTYQELTSIAEDADASIGSKLQAIGNIERLHPIDMQATLKSISEILDRVIENGNQLLPGDDGSPIGDGGDGGSPIRQLINATTDLQQLLDEL